jgi:hypothetical protein
MAPSLLIALLIAAAPPADSSTHRLPPIDECAADPSFAAFRDQLRLTIEQRDAAALLEIVADDIEVDFGGGAGRADFSRTWALDRPTASGVWDELAEALSLGCAGDGSGELYAPSMAAVSMVEDPFEAAVVIRPGAELRAEPDAASPTLAALDWDIVTVPEWDSEGAWQRIVLADGRSGFVRSDDLRSPIDYRAAFRRLDGRWRMTAFIAGD